MEVQRMSSGRTNAVAGGGGLKVIASAHNQSLARDLNVTLPYAASYLLYQVWHKPGPTQSNPIDFAMFLPGDKQTDFTGGGYATEKQFTGTQFFYKAPSANANQYYISYVALG